MCLSEMGDPIIQFSASSGGGGGGGGEALETRAPL